MELENKQKISNFLNRSEEGQLFKDEVVNILAHWSDLRNLKGQDAKVVEMSLKMFTEWIEAIFGHADDYDFQVESDKLRRQRLSEHIYKTE